MKVVIDSREQNRIKLAQDYFNKQGLETTIKELEIGDYIFTDGNDQVVFEFKTIEDFISSIQDNRIFNEAINQAENFNYHYVIIQGNEAERAKQIKISKNYHEVNYYQYLGAIASLNRYTTVIESYSIAENEAFYRMLITAKKCLQNKPIVRRYPRKDINPAFNFLCYCIHGLNGKRATEIVKTYDLHSLKDLQSLNKEKLISITGIGDKLAEKILNAIG